MKKDLSKNTQNIQPLSDAAERINHYNRINTLNMFMEHGIKATTACPLTNTLLNIMDEQKKQEAKKLQNNSLIPAA
jgi:hypothetical protein